MSEELPKRDIGRARINPISSNDRKLDLGLTAGGLDKAIGVIRQAMKLKSSLLLSASIMNGDDSALRSR